MLDMRKDVSGTTESEDVIDRYSIIALLQRFESSSRKSNHKTTRPKQKHIPINPGKKNPSSSTRTTSQPLHPYFSNSTSTSWTSLSTKAMLPCASTPITPFSQISSSVNDRQWMNLPTYIVRFDVSGLRDWWREVMIQQSGRGNIREFSENPHPLS